MQQTGVDSISICPDCNVQMSEETYRAAHRASGRVTIAECPECGHREVIE